MSIQELFHCGVKIESILFVLKSVPFVWLNHVFNRDTTLFQGINNLVGFVDIYARIFLALSNEEGSFDFVGV